jgi:hypothetical protein
MLYKGRANGVLMEMGGRPRSRAALTISALFILVVFTAPISAGADASSGLALSGFIDSPDITGESHSVTYSPDGELVAAGYSTGLAVYNSTTRELVQSVALNDAVYDIEFSESGEFLAAGLRSLESHQKSVVLLSKDTGWNVISDSHGSKRVDAVTISPNSKYVAITGISSSIIEYNSSDFSESVTYDGSHSDKVTCVSYNRNSSVILSGGEGGRLVSWQRNDGSSTLLYHQESSGITDCAFSPADNSYASLSNVGKLQIYSPYGELEHSADLTQATKIKWSNNGLRLFVVQTIGATLIKSYSKTVDTWTENSITSIGHLVSDFDISSDYSAIITATETRHVAEYKESYTPLYYGTAGLDTDGDGVPNDFDEDDDGDGIVDKWDISCSGGISCSTNPNPSLLRNLRIIISEEEVTIFDTVLLTSDDSAALRNITAMSIADDVYLSDQEAYRVADALCLNIIDDDLIDDWQAKLKVEGSSLSDGVVDCTSTAGLRGASLSDFDTRIRFSVFTTFKLSSSPITPYNITISGTVPLPSGSVARIAPLYPVLIEVSAHGSDDFDVQWENNVEGITIFVDKAKPVELSSFQAAIQFLLDNLIWSIPLTIVLVMGLIALIRKRNSSMLNIDSIDDEYDDYDEYEEETEEVASGREMWRSDEGAEPPKPRQGPPPSKRQRLSSDPVMKAKKRRAASYSIPSDSKRIRLDMHQASVEEEPSEWDYGWDATYDDSVEEYGYAEVATPTVKKVKVAKKPLVKEEKKRRTAKRKKSKKKKKATSKDEEDVMSSALDKLVSKNEDD